MYGFTYNAPDDMSPATIDGKVIVGTLEQIQAFFPDPKQLGVPVEIADDLSPKITVDEWAGRWFVWDDVVRCWTPTGNALG